MTHSESVQPLQSVKTVITTVLTVTSGLGPLWNNGSLIMNMFHMDHMFIVTLRHFDIIDILK
jgi:hypothetical protein